jgi:hypothetical protein
MKVKTASAQVIFHFEIHIMFPLNLCIRRSCVSTLSRLLSRKSIELITDNATGGLDLPNYSEQGLTPEQNLRGYGFGLGVRVRENTGASGWLASPGDYGWACTCPSNVTPAADRVLPLVGLSSNQ